MVVVLKWGWLKMLRSSIYATVGTPDVELQKQRFQALFFPRLEGLLDDWESCPRCWWSCHLLIKTTAIWFLLWLSGLSSYTNKDLFQPEKCWGGVFYYKVGGLKGHLPSRTIKITLGYPPNSSLGSSYRCYWGMVGVLYSKKGWKWSRLLWYNF